MNLTQLEGQAFLDSSCPLPLDRPFTTIQAGAEGVLPRQLRWLVTRSYLRRVLKGVYVASQAGDSTQLRCRALDLIVPEDCVITDRHAGWLHGAEMVLAPNEHIDLLPICVFRPSGMGRLRNGLSESGERNVTPFDIVEVQGLAVTSPIRTAWDLGRVRWTEPAISGIDAMLALGVFTLEELLAGIERFRGMRYVTTLRAIAPLADGRSQSPGESVLRLRWIEAHLPFPMPQLEVWVDVVLIAVLDLANADLRYAAEYDGDEWHASPKQQAHDLRRRTAVRDEGWVVDAFVASQVFGRKETASSTMRAGVELARRRFGLQVR